MKIQLKRFFEQLKPWDLFLFLLFIGVSFVPLMYFNHLQSAEATHQTAIISVSGQVAYEVPLIDDGEREEFLIESDHGHYNRIVREGTEISIEDADCTDQLCVDMGSIDRTGETIVCLPHQVLIEVTSESTEDVPEVDAIS
ncbi:NusG domain II-containing protein [Aerococcaceae bacterium DSM 111020]|nr:NusG domain II-containing protein [Aerococcaceae bacterium DSM 111020]